MADTDSERRAEYVAPNVWCWEDGGGSTCTLPDGHQGPHEFMPDSEITVRIDVPLPHRFPEGAPAEVIGWKCAACGEWQDEGAARHSSCTADWRRHSDGQDG